MDEVKKALFCKYCGTPMTEYRTFHGMTGLGCEYEGCPVGTERFNPMTGHPIVPVVSVVKDGPYRTAKTQPVFAPNSVTVDPSVPANGPNHPSFTQRPATREERMRALLSHLEKQAETDGNIQEDLDEIEDKIADALKRRERRKESYKKTWLSFDSNVCIPPVASEIVGATAQVPFRGTDLVVPDSIAYAFFIKAIKVGVTYQGGDPQPMSAEIFRSSAQNRPELGLDTCQIGQNVTMLVENRSAGPLRFSATLFGKTIEDEYSQRQHYAMNNRLPPILAEDLFGGTADEKARQRDAAVRARAQIDTFLKEYNLREAEDPIFTNITTDLPIRVGESEDSGTANGAVRFVNGGIEYYDGTAERWRKADIQSDAHRLPEGYTFETKPGITITGCGGRTLSESSGRLIEPVEAETQKLRCRCDKHDIELGQDPYEAHRKWEETLSIHVEPPKTVILPKQKPGDIVLPDIQHPDEVGRDVGAYDFMRRNGGAK